MVRPRKGKNSPQLRSVSSDGSVNNEKLDEILEKLACLDSITAKLANLESMYAASQAENKQLKEVIDTQNVTIRNLQDRHNNLEQHGRSFSVRVNNFPLDGVDERDPPAIIDKVYKQVFLPILTGAEAIKAISHIPSCYDMIEMAHPLPAKGGGNQAHHSEVFQPKYQVPVVQTQEGVRHQGGAGRPQATLQVSVHG
jgi:hypothetical protein